MLFAQHRAICGMSRSGDCWDTLSWRDSSPCSRLTDAAAKSTEHAMRLEPIRLSVLPSTSIADRVNRDVIVTFAPTN